MSSATVCHSTSLTVEPRPQLKGGSRAGASRSVGTRSSVVPLEDMHACRRQATLSSSIPQGGRPSMDLKRAKKPDEVRRRAT